MNRSRFQSIGFARPSSFDIGGESQIAALKAHGCSAVFNETNTLSSKHGKMLAYEDAVESLREGDELVIFRLDRLGRTQAEVVSNLQELQARGVHLKTLDGLVDTKALGEYGHTLINLLKEVLDLERSIMAEKNIERQKKRKTTGVNLGGRPRINSEKENLVVRLREEGSSYRSIRSQTGLSLSTIRRIILDNQA